MMKKHRIILLCFVWVMLGGVSWNGNRMADAKTKTAPELKTVREKPNLKNLKWDLKIKEKVYDAQIKEMKKQEAKTEAKNEERKMKGKEARKGMRVDSDPQMLARLRKIVDKLAKNSLIPQLPYEVHYIDSDIVNASCYPGGGILVFRGLFDSKDGLIDPKSDDEIAAVLSHEIAHATLRHGYKANKTSKTVGILGVATSILLGSTAGEKAGQIFDSVFDQATGLYFPHYSRSHESAADLEGLFTMMAAGYNPEKAAQVWERAAAKTGNRGNEFSIYASHPANGKRAKDLRRHLENIRGGKD